MLLLSHLANIKGSLIDYRLLAHTYRLNTHARLTDISETRRRQYDCVSGDDSVFYVPLLEYPHYCAPKPGTQVRQHKAFSLSPGSIDGVVGSLRTEFSETTC